MKTQNVKQKHVPTPECLFCAALPCCKNQLRQQFRDAAGGNDQMYD